MIHSVHLDDTSVAGKRFMKEFSCVRKDIEFENPAVTGVVPEGYMTSEQFRKVMHDDVRNFCKKNHIKLFDNVIDDRKRKI
jgi:hypothetical protein